MKLRFACVSVLTLVLLGRLAASSVTPASYSFNQGPGYYDDTGNQLTNGVLADMSGGLTLASSYEFVGWDGGVPSITFNFAAAVTLNQVSLSFANWTSAAVYVPEQVKIGGNTFSLDPNSYVGNNHPAFTFSGNWTGDSLTVDLLSSHSRWIFVDEVTFQEGRGTGPSVPDRAATLPLLGASLLALAGLRRRRARADNILTFHGS